MPSACPCTVMYPAHQDHRIQPYSAYHSNIRTSIFPVSPFMTRYAQCTSAASQTSNRTQSYGFLGRSNTTNDITRIKYFIYLKPHLFKISRPVTNCFFFFLSFPGPYYARTAWHGWMCIQYVCIMLCLLPAGMQRACRC